MTLKSGQECFFLLFSQTLVTYKNKYKHIYLGPEMRHFMVKKHAADFHTGHIMNHTPTPPLSAVHKYYQASLDTSQHNT